MDENTGDLYGLGKSGYIFVCNGTLLDEGRGSCTTVINENDGDTLYYRFALSPKDRLIYYSVNSLSGKQYIKRAKMDGSDPTVLIDTDRATLGVAVDFENSRLYWGEFAEFRTIRSSDLNGQDIKGFTYEYERPYVTSMAIFGERIYVVDPYKGFLSSLKNGQDLRVEHDVGAAYQLAIVKRAV